MSCIDFLQEIYVRLVLSNSSQGRGPILALSPSYLEYTEEGDLSESSTTDCVRVGRGMS